jgi:hypothetical protein
MTRDQIIDTIKLCIREPSCDGCSFEHSVTECRDTLLKAALDFLLEEQPPQGSQDAAEMPEPWTREKVLADAKKNVCCQREHDYGSPEDSFKRIAALWQAYKGIELGHYPGDMLRSMGVKDNGMLNRLQVIYQVKIPYGNENNSYANAAYHRFTSLVHINQKPKSVRYLLGFFKPFIL